MRIRGLVASLLCLPALAAAAPADDGLAARLRTGDLVFHTSRSAQSAPIQAVTGSALSHVGLVEVGPAGPVVVEAVQPVKRTPFAAFRARGTGGRVLVLRPEAVPEAARAAALAEAARHVGKPYDARFAWGDDALYCSELVHKAYVRGAGVTLGTLEPLEPLLARAPPAARAELARRHGGRLPAGLRLVTPASLARDPALRVVHSDFPDAGARK